LLGRGPGKIGSGTINLVVFDVDGTLVTLHPQDDACYLEAIRSHEQLEKMNISSEWDHYQFSTDSGVLYEIFRKHLMRAPSESESRQIESRYTQLLGASLESSPIIREVPGAARAFSFLKTTGNWLPAIATGSWKDSTLLKLQFSGISCDVPLACADDSFDRCEIVKTAIQRASDYYRAPRFSEVVYVGDRQWD